MKTSLFAIIAARIEKSWYQDKWWNFWLLPLSAVFFVISHLRRVGLRSLQTTKKPEGIPLVVIGNINVGGTGKTPLVCFLVDALAKKGVKVGIISRGYGSAAPYYPYALEKNEDAIVVGDEPKLLRDRLGCPVVIGADRNAAIKLVSQQDIDLILSDDGLQHYKMHRDYEIVVLDQIRKLGNGWLLPAGPLREGAWRLEQVDAVIYNGSGFLIDSSLQAAGAMQIAPAAWVNAKTRQRKELGYFLNKKVHAVVGIGNPQRFFTTLDTLSVDYKKYVFADHHAFVAADLDVLGNSDEYLVMTEKDWVKCENFATDSMWYLEVSAQLDSQFEKKLLNDLVILSIGAKY
ncbi:MAG: tetraacyldisaccharide 4'-kinase [Oleispira sp.]|jgi:tetraacyldisaccharide 4'-kinase